MKRKLYKKELDLWKEVTKDDIKINNYISENFTDTQSILTKKNSKSKKSNLEENNKEYNFELEKEKFNNNKLQVNKRMKSKFERGLIRPEAVLDLHGYNRIDGEKTFESFINTCINQQKRCILVITGKRKTTLGSKSILRELVPKWLEDKKYSSLVLAHSFAIKKDGGDGARYVLLRKKRLTDEKNF